MGENPAERKAEVHALQLGLDLGLSLIDTAEMYGEGGAEEVVAEIRAGINTRNIAISHDGDVVAVANYLPHTLVMLDGIPLNDETLADIDASARRLGGRPVGLHLHERDHRRCHREIVADALADMAGVTLRHLKVDRGRAAALPELDL